MESCGSRNVHQRRKTQLVQMFECLEQEETTCPRFNRRNVDMPPFPFCASVSQEVADCPAVSFKFVYLHKWAKQCNADMPPVRFFLSSRVLYVYDRILAALLNSKCKVQYPINSISRPSRPKSTGNGLKSRDNGDVMTENQYDQRLPVCYPKIIPG